MAARADEKRESIASAMNSGARERRNSSASTSMPTKSPITFQLTSGSSPPAPTNAARSPATTRAPQSPAASAPTQPARISAAAPASADWERRVGNAANAA